MRTARRGEIYRVRHRQHGDPKKSRCFAVASRQELLDSDTNRVLWARVNTLEFGLATEVNVGVAEGLKHRGPALPQLRSLHDTLTGSDLSIPVSFRFNLQRAKFTCQHLYRLGRGS